jgi:hypothetical protein
MEFVEIDGVAGYSDDESCCTMMNDDELTYLTL